MADKVLLNYLVNEDGLFHISWTTLVKYNYNMLIREKVKEQLKIEIKAQIKKVVSAYRLLENDKKLRIDSHQHTHMIPIVMEALLEVIKQEQYPTEYIRLSKEPWIVYIKHINLIPTYRIINIIKVIVLNWFSHKDEKLLKEADMPLMLLSGVFLSGKMDIERMQILLPELKKYAQKNRKPLEVLFHPGASLERELGEEFNHPDANKFYLSQNRKTEYNTIMELKP